MTYKCKYLGIKKEKIQREEYNHTTKGFDENGNEIYFEDVYGHWIRTEYKNSKIIYQINNYGNFKKLEDGKEIGYIDGEYFIDGKPAKLKIPKNITLSDLELI